MSETKTLSKPAALAMYKQMDANGKKLMEQEFGKEFFKESDITGKIKSYEDACKHLGLDPDEQLPYKKPSTKRQRVANARMNLDIIAEALQNGWSPDWNNRDEKKWWPWFEWKKSGFAFSLSDCDLWFTRSTVSSRLCFPTEAVSDFFGKQFIDLHNEVLTK